MVDYLFEAFQTVFTPGPSIAVDETVLLWKGRLHFRQYIPLKRARFGIKMFCLADQSGYVYRFRIYTGKEDPQTSMDVILPAECKNFGITEKIVIYLALPLLDSGRTVFMDNWYSSCRLYDYLHYRQTMACGTIRSSRVPLDIRNAKPKVGDIAAFRCGPLLCLKFRDKKGILMLRAYHPA